MLLLQIFLADPNIQKAKFHSEKWFLALFKIIWNRSKYGPGPIVSSLFFNKFNSLKVFLATGNVFSRIWSGIALNIPAGFSIPPVTTAGPGEGILKWTDLKLYNIQYSTFTLRHDQNLLKTARLRLKVLSFRFIKNSIFQVSLSQDPLSWTSCGNWWNTESLLDVQSNIQGSTTLVLLWTSKLDSVFHQLPQPVQGRVSWNEPTWNYVIFNIQHSHFVMIKICWKHAD